MKCSCIPVESQLQWSWTDRSHRAISLVHPYSSPVGLLKSVCTTTAFPRGLGTQCTCSVLMIQCFYIFFCCYGATLTGVLVPSLLSPCLGELSQARHFTFMFSPDLSLWKENSSIDFLMQNDKKSWTTDQCHSAYFFVAYLSLCVKCQFVPALQLAQHRE